MDNKREAVSDVTEEDFQDALILWNYMQLHHVCEKSDIILCLGCHDMRVAEKAASLWLEGMADILVFSGNAGRITKYVWSKPEAEMFQQRALEMGVPVDKILVETKSTNTGENIKFSYQLLCDLNIHPSSMIIVQKPYMERRSYATFMKQWKGDVSKLRVHVTSPNIGLKDYASSSTEPLRNVLALMVGDFARLKIYAEKGFQIAQDIPENVQAAFERLISTKLYNSHLPL